MPYDPYESQKRLKTEHRNTILALLYEQRMTFSQLQKATRFSPTGLTKMLVDLQKDEKIVKTDPKNKKSPYGLSKKGVTAKEFLFPSSDISNIRDSGKYYFDLSNNHSSETCNFGTAFGMDSHLLFDRKISKKYKPFWRKEIFEIEKYVFDILKKRHKHSGIINEKLLKDSKVNKKFFLILELDYNTIIDIMENHSEEKHEQMIETRREEIQRNP